MKKMITILAVIICITTTLSICSYGQELGAVRGQNYKWGFVDETKKVVVQFKYDAARKFSEGFAAVKLDNKWGFIDKTGNVVISLQYYEVGNFSEGLARVAFGWNCYFIDKTGHVAIPTRYQNAGDFSEGLARVKYNGKWGFINKAGWTIIPFIFDDADDFSEGLARVKIKRNWIYIDKTGKEVNKDIPNNIFTETQVVLEQKPKKGSFCLEIQFKPLGNIVIQSNPIGLGSAGISAKCFVAKKSELRIDLLFGSSWRRNGAESSESIAFGLNLGMNQHFNGTERISPYIGFLLGFGVGKTEAKIDNLDFISGNYSSMKIKTSGINFMIPTGFNWYIVNGLYIGAEVGLGLSFEKEFIEIEISINGKKITTNPTASLFGISFYAAPAIRLGWKF